MATSLLPPNFKEFLQLLNSHQIKYLLIGGYAARMTELLREFGFTAAELSPQLFLEKDRIIRMGIPPFRIEVLTGISGVDFDECYAARIVGDIDAVEVNYHQPASSQGE